MIHVTRAETKSYKGDKDDKGDTDHHRHRHDHGLCACLGMRMYFTSYNSFETRSTRIASYAIDQLQFVG